MIANDGRLSIVISNPPNVTRAIYTAFSSYQEVEVAFDIKVNKLSKNNTDDHVLVVGVGRSDALLTDGHFIFYRVYSGSPKVRLEYGENMRDVDRPEYLGEYLLETPQKLKFVINGLRLEIYDGENLLKQVLLESKDHQGFWIGYRVADNGVIDAEISNLRISK